MSIELPPELDWVAKLAVGQDWPKGDEDKLRSLGAAWDDAARQLTAISREIDPATSGVLHSVGGQVADEFTAFTQQLKSNIPDMAEAAGQLGELGRNTGLQVEYAKYMIIAQLVWLAVEIAELAFWAPEAIPVLVTGVRAIVKMLLKRLLISIATGVGFMVGMDAVIQGIQFLKGDRTKWDTAATLQALEGGAIGGAIGGIFSGAGSAFAPKFASSLIGKGLIGGASSIVTTEVMSEIFGGENDMGSALTSGIIGAMGGGGGKRRFGGGEHTEVHTPDIHLPSEPDLHLPKLSFDGEGPHLPGMEDFDTKGLGDKGVGTGGSTGSVKSPATGGSRTGEESGDSTAHASPHATVTESEGPVTGATQKTATTPHVSTESTESTKSTHSTGSTTSTGPTRSSGSTTSAGPTRSTSSTTSHRSPATDYGQDEVAPRAPRAQSPTGQNQAPTTGGQNETPTTGGQHQAPTTGGQNETPTTGGQNHSPTTSPTTTEQHQSPTTTEPHQSPTTTEPHQSPTTEQAPSFPDVPRHEPGTTPHMDTESTAPDAHVTEQLHQLDSVVVPTHDPNPLHQAPTPPTARPVAPDAGIRQRVSDLDRAARAAGMSEADRSAYTGAVHKAAASGDWQRAGEHLSDFRAHVETRAAHQRYDAFHAHAQGGFDRLTDFTGSREEWQSKVDAVEQAHRSGDFELLDSRLNEYSSYVESHVPAESLTGDDAPRPFHQDVEDLRQRLALTTDQPTADRLREQLDSTRQDAELHDRLVQLRSTSDPGATALYERLDNARTPDEANQALHDLEQHREDQRLQQRLDHLKSDEPTPDRPPTPGSDADLRRRLDALNDGADEHERELREQVDRAATPQEADQALRALHEYRADQRLQQRLDRLKSDTPDRPSERELRERLEALHDGEDDPRAAELRRRAQEAATEPEARAALDKLDQHLRQRELDRQDKVRELDDRLEQLREEHTEQLLGMREGAPEDTARRIEDIRTELSSHLTYDERTSALRQELTRPTVTPESPGHLDRITTGTDEHTRTTEDTTPASDGGDALKVPTDHTPSTDSTSSTVHQTNHRTTPAPEPQQSPAHQPHQQPHEQPRHQPQEDQQLQARKEPPQEDPNHPSRQPAPSAEGLDDLHRQAAVNGPSGPPPRMRLDRTPRYVVRSGFDQRRFTVGETSYTDLTVRVALREDGSGAHDADDTWSRAQEGVRRYFNDPRYTLPNGDRLHVTLERVGPDDKPHLTVDLVGAGHDMDQRNWAPGARPVEYAHEISHQLGLRDEYADETAPQRPHILGSLPGDVHRAPEHDELAHGGLRDRHIQLLGALTTGHDDLLAQQGGGQHPRHEDTGDGTAWQRARSEAPAIPRQHAWVDPVSDPTRQPEPKPGEVDAHTARETYGMPEKNFKGFRQIAREKNLVIDVRPTNPTAPKWLDAGAMAKPQDIKAKTINEADVHLGADPKNIGLVGYFKPKTPDKATVPDGDWDKVLSRYNQRSTEYRELNAKMAVYEAEHKFAVKDGVVYGIDGEGRQRPITGDHDLFDISTPGGTRIPHPQHDELIKEMQAKDIAVMHGAHMFWDPPSPFSKTVFDKIVGSHQGPDGEPLLRFRPENKHAELTWTEPLKKGEVNSYTARHTYGIPEKNFKGFRQIAREKNLVIDVRPTNSTAPKWLDAGAMAKPQDIKAKTISEADIHLGADPKNIGLVGYFKPKTPDQATVPDGDWDKVLSRYNQRSTEYRELNAKMELLAKKNKFVVVDGVVHGVGEDGARRPITGDHDLFDISTPGGTRIPPEEHEALIKEMQAKDIAVMHGAHMFWDPPSPFSKTVFDKIVGAHHGPDGEPLLRFRPGHENAELTWTEKPQEQPKPEEPKPEEKQPDAVLDGRHLQGLAGKKITEDPGPNAVRTRVETLLGGHSKDTSVTQRLDAALDPANFRKQHGQMVNGGWRFTVRVDGKPYEVEVKATASAWQLDPTKDAAKDNDGDGFDVPVESTHETAPRKTEMTSSEAGLEFGPTVVRPVNPQLSALVTPSGKLGGATHGRETTVKSSAQTANQFAFTGKTDSYTSDFTYRVKVTDHEGTRLDVPGADGEIKGQVRADVPRPQELDRDRPQAWQGWESDQAKNHAARPASGHPVSVTGLDTARNAVYEALPREARPDGTAHQDIEDFFQPSNVINEFEHASGAGLLSKPLPLSDGGKAHLLLTVEPDDSQALHTVDDKATLGSKSSGEHGQSRTENSSWSLGLSGGATGEVWKATDGSKESTWLTGTAGYTGSSNLAHGVKGKNTIGTEASREHTGKADLVATKVRLRVQLIRHHFGPGPDGLHSTTTTKIGDHSPPPSVKQPTPAPGDVVLTIDPQNGEVLRAVPHELPKVTTGDHPQLEPARLTDPVAAPRTTILDVPGSTELEDHIVREMHQDHPGVLPPPEAVRPPSGAATHPRVTPEAWENLRSLRQQLAPSRLRGGGSKLLDGTYRITLKSPHLPGRSGTTHEILIKAEPGKGDHLGSGKSTTKAVATRTTGADKSVTRSSKHVVNLAGNVRSSLDHPDVTRGFTIGSLDITAHNPSHGLTMGAETEVKRQFSLEADTDTYAHPVTYHVMVGVEDPKQPTTHLSTIAPSPHMQHIKQVKPDGHLTVEVAREPKGSDNPPPASIPKVEVLPQRHAIRHVTASDGFRTTAQQSLTSAFQKKAGTSEEHTHVPELKDALDGLTDEDHLRSLVSASHSGWANSGDEQVGSGRNRDTIGLSTRTRLSNLRFRETLPGEGKLEIETKSSVSTAVADKNTRAFKAGLGFDAGRFPSKDSPDASLQVRGGFKGKGGAGRNSGENIKQKMTTSRKAAYKGTWHLYEADADVTVQGRVTDAKGKITLGDPQQSKHRVLVLLSDDDIRRLGADASKAPDTTGTRQAPLLSKGLLGGATAEIPRSDEILGEIDRQIRGLDQVSDVPESALPFADTFSPENLSANYEDLVGRGILDYHVQESRTQRVITEVLVRGVPRDEWTDEGDHSTGDTTRKVGLTETVKGSAGHNWSLGADGNFRISYAPVVKPKPGEDAAAVKAEENKSGLGSAAWAPSGGAEGSRSKSAETGVTTKVEHKTSKFGDTVRFGNRMRFEVTVTRRTEYGRFVNLVKPRPVEPTWRVHVDVPKSLTETAEQAAAHRQEQQKQQPPKAQQQVLDGGATVEMGPVVPKADRERWQASLDSAHDLVGFDNHTGLFDQAQTVLSTPRPWGDGVLGKTGAALSWGLGSAATTIGHWAGAMTPEAATKLLGSFVSDPRLDASHPLVSEQRLPLEQQFSLRRALGSGTLPTVFHQLKDPASGYRTVPLGSDGKTGVEVRLEPTGDAVEISTRDNGSDEITVSTEHESAATASNGLNASLTPLAVPVTTKNPSVIVPIPTNALKLDRDQTFESGSPVTRAPGVPTRTLAPPVLPHGKTATEPGKATLKGAQVLMRQPVRLSTQKYDESGTYGNTAHTDGHVYYWTAKKTEDATTTTATDTSADTTTSKDVNTSKDDTKTTDATTTTKTEPVKAPEETKQQDTTHKPADTQKPVDTHTPVESQAPVDTKKPADAHESTKPAQEKSEGPKSTDETAQTLKPPTPKDHTQQEHTQLDHTAEDHTAEAPPQPRVPVPGDGRCLLYSVVASTPPEHWPSALHGGTTDHARTQHGAVVHQIRTQRGRVGADSPLSRAARNLHQMVLDRVRSSRPQDLPFDVTQLYRRSQENQLRQTLQGESFEQLQQRLHDAGVDHVASHDWLSPQALRTLYVDTRAQELTGPPHQLSPQEAADRAAAEVPETTDEQGRWKLGDTALAPHAQFAYVTTRTGPLNLDYVDSHDRLVGAVVDTALHQPLTSAEHQALIRAVQNWVPGNDAWNTDAGEMFPGLVAHTLGIRLRTFQPTEGGGTAQLSAVGPQGGNRTVDVYYNGHNHYDASRIATHPADQNTTTVPPKAKQPLADHEAAPKAPKAPRHPETRTASAESTAVKAPEPAHGTVSATAPRRPLDRTPRFVVRSAFDARAFRVGDTLVTDLTVRVAFRDGSGHDPDTAWQRLQQGAEEFYNRPGHRLPDGSLLHVTVERVPMDSDPHLVVDLAGHDRPMDQRTWWPDAEPVAYAHELGHQLGLRDEYRENGEGPGRAQVAGSLLGDFHQPAPHGLAQGGLRGRHLQLLGALVGDVPESVVHTGGEQPHSAAPERDPRWQQARTAAEPVTRRHIWVDPVTDPHRGSGEEHTAQDPRMPQSENSGEHRDEEDLDWSEILQEYTLERRREYEWLDGLYGETLDQESYDRAHDALLTLQSMDLAHPAPDAEHRPHLELLAEQVLHLDEAPSADDYRYLLALTAHAGPESTRDAAALGAHYLATEHGALDHHTALVDASGQVTGRDWTGARAVPPDLTSYTVSGPDGTATEHAAPWREPYVVTALGSPGDGLSVRVDGRTIQVSGPAEFAELVARDPLRGPDQDILLLVSHAQDQGLAQLVADRAGTAVWSTGAEVRPTLDWRTGAERLDLRGGDGGWSLHLGSARGPLDLFDSATPEPDPGGPDYAAKLLPHPGDHTSPLSPAKLLDRLRARPLTTSDYEVIGAEPDTTLFEEPTGMQQTGFDYDRGSGDVPRLIVPTQGHRQTPVSQHPPLHVSGDLSLAHRQGGYGQQVFASPKAIESANHQLALAGSLVRLKPDGIKLRVGDGQGGRRELVRVVPQFLTRSGKSEEEICRDFAQMVSGNVAASHVVFRGPDGTGLAKAPINALGRTEVTGIHHLAESLTLVADGQRPEALDPAWAAQQVRRDDRFIAESDGPTPGKSYGSALSYDPLDNPRRDNLSDAAREIGINEHAWAKVGEAYLVHSINALDADGLPSLAHNYAKPGEQDHSHFGYHFAAVVLGSEDGRHQITLENFARRAHVAAIVKSAVAHNLRHATPDGFHKLHEAIGRELESARRSATDEAQVKRLERHLALADALARAVDARQARDATTEGSPEGVAADAAYEKAVKVAEARMKQASELAKGSDLWHFRMFSQRPGESMHEISADLLTNEPSAEANPLTSVIVHGHRLPQVDIGFREGSRQISRDEGRKLNYVAELATRTGLWNHHNGLPLPRITVTGRGNARRPTLGGVLPEAARQRAEAVHGELRDRLDRYLINYQHGISQRRLTAADFPVAVTTEHPAPGGDREQGRRTTVAVHDPRPEDTAAGTTTTPPSSEAAPRAPRAPQSQHRTPEQPHQPTDRPSARPHHPATAPAPAPAPRPTSAPPSSYRSERLTIGGVEFADGSVELTGGQRETVHRLAAEVAWASVANTRAGFPPPRVVVVGHANGMRGGLPHFGEALRRGQARADGVAEVFRSALAVHLARLQADGETVTLLADIEVTTRSEGNAPPPGAPADTDSGAARRQAFVVVELPRPGGGDAR
ncbi:hypothetical protein ACTAF0_29765 [Streptomyces murinus]|uniref:WXG100-like domain-containing protein n=1 Tax=Streptomyces murinus TaxID=33900 RepID=UPI003F44EB09